jgi:hypothetical protein
VASGALTVIIEAMKRYLSDSRLLQRACGLLRNVTQNSGVCACPPLIANCA